MTTSNNSEYLCSLANEFRKLPRETEWLEFKVNKAEPEEIGEYISALSNSAILTGKASAYMIWGIDNNTQEIVGTEFSPFSVKVGNEELENWLLHLLSPKIHFRFHEFQVDERKLVLLEIGRASRQPVQFRNQEFVRVGSYKKKLKEFPEKERELWRIFDQIPFEHLVAAEEIGSSEVLQLLDYPAYFDLLKIPLPMSRDGILQALEADELICQTTAGQWNITNLGAILFAK